nr:MAG TPA: hypothetical protein [Caudoviricetes sp.]
MYSHFVEMLSRTDRKLSEISQKATYFRHSI